jgi:SWI/SNF-related matrix-associated actin-dependent regulator of chromatin subfamily A member 5
MDATLKFNEKKEKA